MSADRQIAIGDLLLFTPLALPWVGGWIVELLLQLNAMLGLPGSGAAGSLPSLLVNLLGLFGVCFALIRLQQGAASLRREAMMVKIAAAVLIVIAILRGAPAILAVIAVADAVAAAVLRFGAGSAAHDRGV